MVARPASTDAPAEVAGVIGATLARLGVTDSFGVVGSGNFLATNALVAAGASFHPARHEGGAICMADGYGRASGRIAVCSVHQGPGLTNAITGLAEAAKARTPLVVLAGDTAGPARDSNFRIDQHGLAESVGAIAELIYRPGTAAADTERAYRRSLAQRRPVVLMAPIDIQALPASGEKGAGRRQISSLPQPRPAARVVSAAADLLEGSQTPLFVGGRGAVLSRAAEPIVALAERCGALLATSAMANGLFEGRAFDLGISGGFSSPLAAEMIPRADLILSFGASLNDWTTRHGALVGPAAKLIQVDLEVEAIGNGPEVELAILGDAAATAEALLEELEERGHVSRGWRSEENAELIERRRWREESYEDCGSADRIDPRTLSIELDRRLSSDRTVVVDSGHFLGYPAMYLGVPDARSWIFPNAFQAVGLGLGCAIGAAVARPERITVAAVGDGGLFMALEELETAARLGLRLLVVVYNDAAYGAEEHHFGPLGHDTSLVRFPDVDLAAIARGCGAAAQTVRSTADLDAVEEWAQSPAGPLLLDAKVEPSVCADWLAEAFRGG